MFISITNEMCHSTFTTSISRLSYMKPPSVALKSVWGFNQSHFQRNNIMAYLQGRPHLLQNQSSLLPTIDVACKLGSTGTLIFTTLRNI